MDRKITPMKKIALLLTMCFLHYLGCQTEALSAPVVLELFTSEGCSSCPPADKVLSEIAEKTPIDGVEIIPIGWHVDYWNKLGWTDRFSKEDYTRRQYAYAQSSKRESVFTPEAVLNGLGGINGADRTAILKGAQYLAERPGVEVKMVVSFTEPETLTVNLETPKGVSIPEGESLDVLVVITEDNLITRVERGENSGRTLRHDAVVREFKRVGVIRDDRDLPFKKKVTMDWNPDWSKENSHVVVLLQEHLSQLILGAGTSPAKIEAK
ncbi:MAG: DUF1223 domain-containing protein [Candidatus Omnitrophica bacterium]|nr:DUF1223 domain-containing protein [Candidatus Omnitrophota bacterium]